VQTKPHLEGILDGKAQVDYLQSDDMDAANSLRFNGAPEYVVKPARIDLAVRNCMTT
jgi:hypothetical protein